MRPQSITVAQLGPSPWLPVDYVQQSFAIGFGCTVTSGASLTYSVQHTFDGDSNDRFRNVVIARAGTVATVTATDHRLSVGDAVIINGTGSTVLDSQMNGGTPNLPIPWTVASVVDADNYTYTVANSGATTGGPNAMAKSFRIFNHAVVVGQTGRIDGNYAFPIAMLRLNVTVYASGKATILTLQGK